MATIIDQMTELYCYLDEYFKAQPVQTQWRHSPNCHPAFTDAEVLTIGLMQGCLGVATLKQTYRLMANNFSSAFPQLCSYKQWLARLHQLAPLLPRLLVSSAALGETTEPVSLMDAKPIPLCRQIRHGRVVLLRDEGAHFGKSSTGWFFGFKLHVLLSPTGSLRNAILTPANWPDRDVALALATAVEGGLVIGDLAYRGPDLRDASEVELGTLLLTPADAAGRRNSISRVRERVETFFSQLWHRFIDRVYSRSWRGLWNTIELKLIHYNLRHADLLSA